MEHFILAIFILVVIFVLYAWRRGWFISDAKIEREIAETEQKVQSNTRPKYTTRLDGSTHD